MARDSYNFVTSRFTMATAQNKSQLGFYYCIPRVKAECSTNPKNNPLS